MASEPTKHEPLKRIEPHFSVSEDEASLLFHWRNGDKSLSIWEDKDPAECLYHGLSSTEDIDFETIYAAYEWLVSP